MSEHAGSPEGAERDAAAWWAKLKHAVAIEGDGAGPLNEWAVITQRAMSMIEAGASIAFGQQRARVSPNGGDQPVAVPSLLDGWVRDGGALGSAACMLRNASYEEEPVELHPSEVAALVYALGRLPDPPALRSGSRMDETCDYCLGPLKAASEMEIKMCARCEDTHDSAPSGQEDER